jgi:hypothetical protein
MCKDGKLDYLEPLAAPALSPFLLPAFGMDANASKRVY